jgi:predicted Zn-dependent peptidase
MTHPNGMYARSRTRRPAAALVAAALVAAALAGAFPAAAAKKAGPAGPRLAKFPATVETLANGLKVILIEDHSVPVVSRWTFYRVGARNERPGITGISHYIEHMMFNGAEKYGPKEFDRILESNGGYSNAYTSEDMTAYYEDFASDILELCIDLDSDRMRSLAFDPKFVVSEMGVVREERRLSVDNSIDGVMWEELSALAYKAHPYGWGVIGWDSDLAAITRDDAVTYWKSYYSPNNAVLVIVGDFETKRALELVRTYYGDIPAQPPVPPVRTVEPEQWGERRGELRRSAEMPALLVGYHIPNVKSHDIYALDVLQIVLSGGESSRLYKKLVRDLGIAVYAQANAEWKIDPGLFTFDVKLKPGMDPAAGERALYDELDAIAAGGITAAELEKAKNRVLSSFYNGIQTVNGKANRIGRYELLFGDFNEIYKVQDRYQAVTVEDVKRVAGEYFKKTNRNVMTLIPEA